MINCCVFIYGKESMIVGMIVCMIVCVVVDAVVLVVLYVIEYNEFRHIHESIMIILLGLTSSSLRLASILL